MTQETIASIITDLLFDMEIGASEENLHEVRLRPLYVEKLLDGLSRENGLIVSTMRLAPKRPGRPRDSGIRHFVHHENTGRVLLEIRQTTAPHCIGTYDFKIVVHEEGPIPS
jgi:hypothetical protein